MIEKKPSFLVGLIGAGIQASLTPAMHEGEGDRHGVRYLYRLMDLDVLKLGADSLPRLLDAAQLAGFCGLNITHPCKQSVIPLLDELSENAAAIGAVNTVVFRNGRRVGHNTDCWGFEQNMRATLPQADLHDVILLGAGGAGAAVAHGLMHLGAGHVHIHDINADRAAKLVSAITHRFGAGRASVVADLTAEVGTACGIVHATPTGMAHYPGLPLPAPLLTTRHWVAEIVYFPLETEFLALARRIGCHTTDGRGMAVNQAVRAFQLFTGLDANAANMQHDFESLVAEQVRSTTLAASVG